MRKNISYCHPSFSLENVQGSSNSKEIKSGRSLDLAYQLGAMTRRGYSRDCHVNNDNNSLSYVREADNKNLLAGELDISFNLTQSTSPQSSPSKERKSMSYSHPSFSLENVKGSSNSKEIKSGRSLDLAYQLGAMTMIALFSFNAHSACTPTPDCASIGYTETSCEGASLKCPFDITKLYCIPCDTSFKYDCNDINTKNAIGNSCNNKYVSCECVWGATLSIENGCTCDTSCKVGAIYYSDRTCSSCIDNNKTIIGIVVKDNELIMSGELADIAWGIAGIDIDGLSNYSNGTIDFNGKDNTTILVTTQTSTGLTSANSAAIYCNEYTTEGTSVGDWYLPAAGEMYSYVYGNFTTLKTSTTKAELIFRDTWYCTSTEVNKTNNWSVRVGNGQTYTRNKEYTGNSKIICFLPI